MGVGVDVGMGEGVTVGKFAVVCELPGGVAARVATLVVTKAGRGAEVVGSAVSLVLAVLSAKRAWVSNWITAVGKIGACVRGAAIWRKGSGRRVW